MNNNGNKEMHMRDLGETGNLLSSQATLIFSRISQTHSTMVKVLCYKSEGRWFDSKWFHWNFSVT